MAKFPDEITTKVIKKQIIELKNSYHSPFDVTTELVQNAVDAVRLRSEKDNSEYQPKIDIEISQRDKFLKISDNGDGMLPNELDSAVKMYYSGKEDNANTVGEKGVGLSFTLFSTNEMGIKSIHNGIESSVKIMSANKWLKDLSCNDPYQLEVLSKKSSEKNRTEITINELIDDSIFKLTKNQIIYYLRSQTAIGNFSNAFNNNNGSNFEITLKLIDKDGIETTEIVPYKYYLLDDLKNKSNIMDFSKYFQTEAAILDDTQKRMKLNGKYLLFKGSKDVRNRTVRWIGYFTPSGDVWKERNENLNNGETLNDNNEFLPKLKYGSYLSVKDMPTGIFLEAETKGNSGYYNRMFILLDDDSFKFDLGRKSIKDGRVLKTPKAIVKEEFGKYRSYIARYVKKYIPEENILEDDTPSTIINRMRSEQTILDDQYDTKFLGVPDQEGSIAAIFFEQLGKGNITNNIRILSHGYNSKYDVYALLNKYNPITIDFKLSIKGLLEDINAGVKNPNELDYVVVWKLEDSDIKIINQPKYAVSFDEFKRSLDDKHLRASGALLFTNIQNHKIYIIELEKLMNNNIV